MSPILLDSDGLGEIGNKNKDKVDCVKSAFEIIDKLTEIENEDGTRRNKMVYQEKDKKEFMFVISPKGKVANSPWRSGYYVIAKELGCKIIPCGLDYEHKCLSFEEPFTIENHSKQDMDHLIQFNQPC